MPMYYLQLVLVCLLYSIFYCLEAEYIEAANTIGYRGSWFLLIHLFVSKFAALLIALQASHKQQADIAYKNIMSGADYNQPVDICGVSFLLFL